MRLDVPVLSRREARELDLPHNEIRDGLTLYSSTPRLGERLGVPWAKVDVGSMLDRAADAEDAEIDAEALIGWNESDPADLLRFLEVAGEARPVGEARIGGAPVTRHAADVDLRR